MTLTRSGPGEGYLFDLFQVQELLQLDDDLPERLGYSLPLRPAGQVMLVVMEMIARREGGPPVPWPAPHPSSGAPRVEGRGLVAWITSHCTTPSHRSNVSMDIIHVLGQFSPKCCHREEYVRELSQHLPVHIYGGCGHRPCPGRMEAEAGTHDGCFEAIARFRKISKTSTLKFVVS